MASVALCTSFTLGAGTPAGAAGASWSTYHGDAAGTGVAAGYSRVITSSRAWASRELDGELYGEPLVVGGDVIVATQRDVVYALSAGNGAVRWSRRLADPVPSSDLPCGNISPDVGITGTPVIDVSRDEVFVVADELVGRRIEHRLVGLDAQTGATMLSESVDPPGSDHAALLQRTGLTLDDGRVVFGFGGNYGDCGPYRGRVVAVPEGGGRPEDFTVDARGGEREGAVWMGGAAPVVNAEGDVLVSVGNGSATSSQGPYDHSDSVLELSPSMHLMQYFAPTTWPQDNAERRRLLDGAGDPSARAAPHLGQEPRGLPARREPPRRDRRPGGEPVVDLWRRRRRRVRRRGRDGLRAVHERTGGAARRDVTAARRRGLALVGRGRAARRRRRARVDDRPGRNPLRAGRVHGVDAPERERRRAGQSLSHPRRR